MSELILACDNETKPYLCKLRRRMKGKRCGSTCYKLRH